VGVHVDALRFRQHIIHCKLDLIFRKCLCVEEGFGRVCLLKGCSFHVYAYRVRIIILFLSLAGDDPKERSSQNIRLGRPCPAVSHENAVVGKTFGDYKWPSVTCQRKKTNVDLQQD